LDTLRKVNTQRSHQKCNHYCQSESCNDESQT